MTVCSIFSAVQGGPGNGPGFSYCCKYPLKEENKTMHGRYTQLPFCNVVVYDNQALDNHPCPQALPSESSVHGS